MLPAYRRAFLIQKSAGGGLSYKVTNHIAPEAQKDIVMIGGAYGATTILCDDSKQKNLHIACSALHFEPVSDDIEWWVEFNITHPLKKNILAHITHIQLIPR